MLGLAPPSFLLAHPPCPASARSVPSTFQFISPSPTYLVFPGSIKVWGAAILPASPRLQIPAGKGGLKTELSGAQVRAVSLDSGGGEGAGRGCGPSPADQTWKLGGFCRRLVFQNTAQITVSFPKIPTLPWSFFPPSASLVPSHYLSPYLSGASCGQVKVTLLFASTLTKPQPTPQQRG